jgi:hypothetical protein
MGKFSENFRRLHPVENTSSCLFTTPKQHWVSLSEKKKKCLGLRSVCTGVWRMGTLEVAKLWSPFYTLRYPACTPSGVRYSPLAAYLSGSHNVVRGEAVTVWQALIPVIYRVSLLSFPRAPTCHGIYRRIQVPCVLGSRDRWIDERSRLQQRK